MRPSRCQPEQSEMRNSPSDVLIRYEVSGDSLAVRTVHCAAFGQSGEADLVDALRESGNVALSLVAESAGRLVGHILFSPVWIDGTARTVEALALAPLAVLPEHQRKGIGSTLVTRGLELCAEAGHLIVLVVGHPEYYQRFGFAREHAKRLDSPYQGDAFLGLELAPGVLSGVSGRVRYVPAFESL